MSKRKFEGNFLLSSRKNLKRTDENVKKHSLDSDEEDDNYDADDILHEDDIEGEEDGVANDDGEVRITAFNMREEMEEGHFDAQGHFIWKNEKEVKDNWLDNIDWQRIKTTGKDSKNINSEMKGLGDESDSDEEKSTFDELLAYKKLIPYLDPKETVTKALRRLGGTTEKLSSIERLKRKKAGTLDVNQKLTELTALADSILTEMGNMDVYQESFEYITDKISKLEKKRNPQAEATELDMYSDDFETKEKKKLDIPGTSSEEVQDMEENGSSSTEKELQWEYKLILDSSETHGPFTTQQMVENVEKGIFKNGAWARKIGVDNNFYTTNRIDFELFLS